MTSEAVVVVGGGHNGLVCAAYLARAGVAVTVLEARPTVGGCTSTVEAIGARVNVCNCDHSMIRGTSIPEELGLERFGLRYLEVAPVQLSLTWSDEAPWFLFSDVEATLASIGRSHPGEVAGYRNYLKAAIPVARLVQQLSADPVAARSVLHSLAERRGAGTARLLAWSRRSAAEIVRSYFASEALRGPVLTTGPAVWGLSPESAGTGLGALGYAVRHLLPVGRPEGGSGGLPAAIAASLQASGGSIRTGATVAAVRVTKGAVHGVRLASGEEIEATVVVVATDPRQAFVEWLTEVPPGAARLVRRWRRRPVVDGYESKLDAVVAERPRFRALERRGGPAAHGVDEALVPTAVVALPVPEMVEAHRAMARGRVAGSPMLFVNVPSVLDPTMAVADGDVLSLEVLFTPYRLAGGWVGSVEPERWLERFARLVQPGWRASVRRYRAMTPPDFEAQFHLSRGHAPSFAGGPLVALMGRDPELLRYETAIPGLFLTGGATFPGAGVWGASGRATASVVLRHLGAPALAAVL